MSVLNNLDYYDKAGRSVIRHLGSVMLLLRRAHGTP